MGMLLRFWCVVVLVGVAGQADASEFAEAVEKRQWAAAERAAAGDVYLRTYAHWRRLKDHYSDVSFDELARFIRGNPDWPDLNILRQRAEKLLFVENRREESKDWLIDYPPISGYGKLALARLEKGNVAALVKDGWIEGDFDARDEPSILDDFGHYLSRADHLARIKRLLRDDRASIAERHLHLVDKAHQKLFRARIALIRFDVGVDTKIAAVPDSLKQDHGLVADRIRWRAKKGLEQRTLALLRQMDPQSPYTQKVWHVRAWHVREFLESRQYDNALELLERAGTLDPGANAERLWLKGWIYLEYRKAPRTAYEAFAHMFQDVNFPVSKARAAYWAARSAQVAGQNALADRWYDQAARYPTVFYGQLAYARQFHGQPLRFPDPPRVNDNQVERYMRHPVFITAQRLTDRQEPNLAVKLISHLAEIAATPGDIVSLVRACARSDMPLAQVRAIKAAIKQNIIMAAEGWPIIELGVGIPIEPALAFAIARQESEFNPQAVSPAGARGLMQIMPATGRRLARKMNLRYSPERLFNPAYNLRMGGWYLGSLIDRFAGSYILAIAGYNAGPGRSEQWVRRFAQPGRDLRATLNWMETIPFKETRNYVQRVLENLQVYRARLNPDAPLMIESDLLR